MSKELTISNTLENFSIDNISIEVIADIAQELDRRFLDGEITKDIYWEMKKQYNNKLTFEKRFEVNEILINRTKSRMEAI